MAKKRAEVVVKYPQCTKIVASVATTKSMIIVTHGDGRQEHSTYPPDGRFHVTPHHSDSARSFLDAGPAYSDLTYFPLAKIEVPVVPNSLVRDYRPSSAQSMTLSSPVTASGDLEVGILGRRATPSDQISLAGSNVQIGMFPGPRSDTTIVIRYLQGS
jgi:hypothetical protein